MLGLIAAPVLAVSLAVLFGGSFSHWSNVNIRWWPLAAAGLLIQVALFSPFLEQQPWAIAWGKWLYVGTLVGVLLALLGSAQASRHRRFPLSAAAVGITLNCLVIVLNGGYMPRSEEAAVRVGRSAATAPEVARLTNVQPMNGQTRLWWLGDIIPQPSWLPMANVVSVGDLLMVSGLAWWAFGVTLPSDRWPTARRRSDTLPSPLSDIPG